MKSKSLEQQIKSQINQGEISPSRDLWKDIENQMKHEIPNKTSHTMKFGYVIAASIILLLSLGIIFINNSNETHPKNSDLIVKKDTNKTDTTPIADTNTNTQTVVIPISDNANNNVKDEIGFQHKKVAVEIRKNTPQKEIKTHNVSVPNYVEIPIIQTVQEKPKIAHQNLEISKDFDNNTSTKKIKNFVDPKTLLFSVEHKDIIQNTKKSTNIASIELE